MNNPLARLKEIFGELQRNGRLALASLQEQSARLAATQRQIARMEARIDSIEGTVRGRAASGQAGNAPAECGMSDTGTETPQARERILRLAELLVPHRINGLGKTRVGGRNDGGYIMLDDWTGLQGALSIGIGNDDAWDRAVAARGISVAQFDHTITGPPGMGECLMWQPLGLGAVDVNNIRTLRSLIGVSGLATSGDLVLKVDAEAAEWPAFTAGEPVAPLDRFRQIVIEFHWFDHAADETWFDVAEAALLHFARTHSVVHVHANNWGGMVLMGGIPFPRVLEVTYARRDRYKFLPEEADFPTPIDAPCDPSRQDLFLGRFHFPRPRPRS